MQKFHFSFAEDGIYFKQALWFNTYNVACEYAFGRGLKSRETVSTCGPFLYHKKSEYNIFCSGCGAVLGHSDLNHD